MNGYNAPIKVRGAMRKITQKWELILIETAIPLFEKKCNKCHPIVTHFTREYRNKRGRRDYFLIGVLGKNFAGSCVC